MLNDWFYIGVFILVALFLPAAAITIAAFLSPKRANPVKNAIYECGMETVGEARVQFKIQYYVLGLIFLVFDIETVFLFPFAVAYQKVTLFGLLEAVLFILILLGGLAYAWRKGALEWV